MNRLTHRRNFLIVLMAATTAAATAGSASAQGGGALWSDALDHIKDCADAFGELADKVMDCIAKGDHAWSVVAARRLKGHLEEVSQKATFLAASAGSTSWPGPGDDLISRYIESWRAAAADDLSHSHQFPGQLVEWDAIRSALSSIVGETKGLLTELMSERSDFVATRAYSDLVKVLGAKEAVMTGIETMPAPQTALEIESLAKANAACERLWRELDRARDAVNAYISAMPSA